MVVATGDFKGEASQQELSFSRGARIEARIEACRALGRGGAPKARRVRARARAMVIVHCDELLRRL